MPVYDFTCQSCGKTFDKLFRTAEKKPAASCPECGSERTKRALSLVNAGAEKTGGSGPSDAPLCGRCGQHGPCAD